MEIVTGSILDSKEKYIIHQCNCLTTRSAGTAKDIFTAYPHADVYKDRIEPNVPGTIIISGNGLDQRFVINLFGQYYPGKPKYPDSKLDGMLVREKYFHRGLIKVSKINDLKSIAFPWKIGCNLGGGIWEHYLGTISNFAHYVEEKFGTKVVIYRRESDE